MATVVGDIAIAVGADIGPLVTDLARGQAAVSRFGASAQASATGGMRAFAVAAGAISAAAITAGLGLAALTRKAVEAGGELYDNSRKLGVHTAALQAMSQVANEAGVATDSLVASLAKMQNNIAGLQDGTKAQVQAFDKLGLSVRDLVGLSADQQFALIARSIEAIEDPAQRTASAMDIFGKSGADLISMMSGYGEAVDEVAKKQRELGIALTDQETKALDDAGDAVGRLSMAIDGLANRMAVNAAPAIIAATAALSDFVDAVTYTNDEINQMAIDLTFDKVDASVKQVKDSVELTAGAFAGLNDGKISAGLIAQVNSINAAKDAYDKGAISADEYKAQVLEAVRHVQELYATITLVGGVNMVDATREMGKLADEIDVAFKAAQRLMGILPGGAVPMMHPRSSPAVRNPGGDMLFPAVSGLSAGPGGLGSLPSGLGMEPVVSASSVSNGGGGGGADIEAELKALRDGFKSEQQLIEDQYAERLAKLEEFRQAKLLTEEEFNTLEAQAKADHEKAMAAMEAQAMQVKMDAISGAFGDLGSLMQTQNEKLFRIGKAASIAKAIVDGYESATAAWKKGMQIGGPGLAAAFTAASLARTGAMISGISRTQIGGAQAPSVGSGGAGAVSAPAAPLEVRLTGFGPGDMFTGGMIGSLLDKLSAEAGDRGYKIMVAA